MIKAAAKNLVRVVSEIFRIVHDYFRVLIRLVKTQHRRPSSFLWLPSLLQWLMEDHLPFSCVEVLSLLFETFATIGDSAAHGWRRYLILRAFLVSYRSICTATLMSRHCYMLRRLHSYDRQIASRDYRPHTADTRKTGTETARTNHKTSPGQFTKHFP